MEAIFCLVTGLAWPVTAIWLAYLFRPAIQTLIERLETLKVPGGEAKFKESLEKVEDDIIQRPPTKVGGQGKHDEIISKLEGLRRIAAVSPRAAIMEAWVLVETAASSSAALTATNRRPTSIELLHHIATTGHLSQEDANLVISLRNLRNQAAHLPDFVLTQEEAERYLDLAVTVSELIEDTSKTASSQPNS